MLIPVVLGRIHLGEVPFKPILDGVPLRSHCRCLQHTVHTQVKNSNTAKPPRDGAEVHCFIHGQARAKPLGRSLSTGVQPLKHWTQPALTPPANPFYLSQTRRTALLAPFCNVAYLLQTQHQTNGLATRL